MFNGFCDLFLGGMSNRAGELRKRVEARCFGLF